MNNRYRVLFFIKKNEPKKNGHSTIMIRITFNKERVQFSSGLDVKPAIWDQKAEKVIGKKQFANQINNRLDMIRTKLFTSYLEASNKGKGLSAQYLKNTFLGIDNSRELMLVYQFKKQLKFFKTKTGFRLDQKTLSRYELTLNIVIEFMRSELGTDDIHIQKIDLYFIERFYFFIREKYSCINNTAIKYVQRLASIVSYACKIGLIDKNPFLLFNYRLDKTSPIYLNEDEINKIWRKKFLSKRLEQIRDYFVFSCFTGLSFIDMCSLKSDDIKVGPDKKLWIMILRQKTGLESNIPLLKIPLEIIKKYEDENTPNKNLFPIKSNQKTNEYLKEIADLCNIKKNVTFRVSRHSFATLAISNGVSIEAVSKMLGHTNVKTTQIYAQITSTKISKEMAILETQLSD
ncbi:site-specific integrase [Dysgonomonas sp. GY75]|uniref:site-specific integrase n=1 Tax=Dysgonomonas sp. GY75 TaxID=2780419 RepID=UPI0018842CD8|nr:site-specific integrase [Dysgonomonas sp. GY75]MBF0649277.1 site-specific integrase [Dysgonomonas sp. GY75]